MGTVDVSDRMLQLAHVHHNEPRRDCPHCPPCCYGEHCSHRGGCHCLIARDGTHYSCKCGPPGVSWRGWLSPGAGISDK